jgi:hypothetical protein
VHSQPYLTDLQAAALQATLQQVQQALTELGNPPKQQQQQIYRQQQEKHIDGKATAEAAHFTIAARGTLDAAGHVITPAAAAAAAAALEAAAAHHHQQQQAWQRQHSCAFCGESFPSGEAFWAHCLMPHHMLQLLVRGQMQLGCGQLGLPALQGWWRQPLTSPPAAAAARGAAVGTDDELAVLLEKQEAAEQQQQQQRVATAKSALRKMRGIVASIEQQQQQQDLDDAADTACSDSGNAAQVAAGRSCQICSEEWVGEAQLLAHFT